MEQADLILTVCLDELSKNLGSTIDSSHVCHQEK